MQCCAARPKKAHPGPHQSPSRERANGGAPRGAHDDFGPPRATRQPRKAGGQPPATVERPTTLAPYGEKEQPIEEDSDDGNEVFFDADEEFQLVPGTENGAASGGVVDYGVGEEGQCVIGGRWVNATQAINALEGGFTVTKAIGWDQPDPRETEPLTAAEAADSAMLAKRVGDALYRTLPADLQLAFVRDVYGNYEGCGWTEEQAIPNTVEVMRNAARWRAEIDAENLHKSPDLPREDVFRDYAQHAFSGQDKWGHPRIWGTVTGWPPIKQEIVDNFSAEEVMKMHTKRFLEFQDKKRKISEELQRTIILHCCILAFEPTTTISLKNAKWFNAACQFVGGPRDDGLEPESYTTDQWFFPMSLNAPAIVVNVPWKWRTAYGIAKKFMVEETANKFVLLDGDFLPKFRELGIPYDEIPPWMLELHTGAPLTW